jgi:hypothetical protein
MMMVGDPSVAKSSASHHEHCTLWLYPQLVMGPLVWDLQLLSLVIENLVIL